MSKSVPEIAPPVIVALPEFRLVAVAVVNDAVPPVMAALAVVIVENVPAADVLAPIAVPSIAPPFTSMASNVLVPVEVTLPVTLPV